MMIQHNIPALNSYRNERKNKSSLNKNLERLSSGYKINRAGDDAAGLSISEGLRAAINGTAQAENNIMDGIGLIRTAEGAMQEIHSMLERAYKLGIAASNDTYTESNRKCMQGEINQLLAEIDRIAGHTEFNGITVLQGERTEGMAGIGSGGGTATVKKLPDWVRDMYGSFDAGKLNHEYITREHYQDGRDYNIPHASAVLDFSAFDGSAAKIADLVDSGFNTTCLTCGQYYSIEFVNGTGNHVEQSGEDFIFQIDINGCLTGADLTDAIIAGTQEGKPNGHFTRLTADGGKLTIYDDRCSSESPVGTEEPEGWSGWDFPDFNVNLAENPKGGNFGNGVKRIIPGPPGDGTVIVRGGDTVFQIGPSSSEYMEVDLPNIDMWEMGVKEIKVITRKRAVIATETLKNTIDFISGERGRMGAYENRLEHAYDSLAVSRENLTAAESRIRDTDMAEEVTSYTKNNIILQAAQSMLAQANALPQATLQLLQA